MVYILYATIKYTRKKFYVWIKVCYAAIKCNMCVNIIFDTVLNTFLCLKFYYNISSSFFSQPEIPHKVLRLKK